MSRFKPTPKIGSDKYGEKGLFTSSSFQSANIARSDRRILEIAANHSLSAKTWSSYNTVKNMLELCENQTSKDMTLPMNEGQTLSFIAWLVKRGLKARSINSYLSGLRMLHLTQGVELRNLRSELVKQVIEGQIHIDSINNRLDKKQSRLPVTPTILKLLKMELKDSGLSKEEKRLLWSVSTIAFAGGFRVGELLARVEASFDPLFTLLGEDVKLVTLTIKQERVETIQIKIKSQKTDRIGVDCIIDVYESNGAICPVSAYKKWRATTSVSDRNLPAFSREDGRPLTSARFNKYLKSLLGKHIDYTGGAITGHSFRAGIASLLGNLGYSDVDIQSVGRWSSRAFEAYLKLPRTKRVEMARKIGEING